MATSNLQDYSVGLANSDNIRTRIYGFRYATLVAGLGAQSKYADENKEQLVDDLDADAAQVYVAHKGAIAATVRVISGTHLNSDRFNADYKLDQFKSSGRGALTLTDRLTVPRESRNPYLLQLILAAGHKSARHIGSKFDFRCCAPGMVMMYEKLGYRRYADNFESEEDGYQVPMVLVTEDIDYLKTIRSPLIGVAAEFKNSGETSEWFQNQFPNAITHDWQRLMDEEQLWKLLTDKLNQTPLEGIPLIAGLSYADAKSLFKMCPVLQCRAGDRIVRSGDHADQMYIVLSGAVEVRAGNDQVIATLGPGEMFGERSLFHETQYVASVTAAEAVDLLAITSDFVDKLKNQSPHIAATLLYNLARIVTERLGESSDRLIKHNQVAGSPE